MSDPFPETRELSDRDLKNWYALIAEGDGKDVNYRKKYLTQQEADDVKRQLIGKRPAHLWIDGESHDPRKVQIKRVNPTEEAVIYEGNEQTFSGDLMHKTAIIDGVERMIYIFQRWKCSDKSLVEEFYFWKPEKEIEAGGPDGAIVTRKVPTGEKVRVPASIFNPRPPPLPKL